MSDPEQPGESITQTSPSEREELLEFRARMYGPGSVYAAPDWVTWLYDEAPAARETGPWLWVVRQGGRIEGHHGGIVTRIRMGNTERSFVWLLDFMVSPACRGSGLGGRLIRIYTTRDRAAAGSTEVSEGAQRLLKRMEWNELENIPLWVLPVDPIRLIRARVSTKLPLGVLAPAAQTAATSLRLVSRLRTGGRKLVRVDQFDHRADAIWERCSREWPIIARRDRQWLRWRWESCPRKGGAFGVWLVRGDEAIGWAVLQIGSHAGVPAGLILDLLCPPGELGALVALCAEELCRHPIAGVYFLFRAPGVERLLSSYGFIRRDSGFNVMSKSLMLLPHETVALADPHLWFVTAGDNDLARPRENTQYA